MREFTPPVGWVLLVTLCLLGGARQSRAQLCSVWDARLSAEEISPPIESRATAWGLARFSACGSCTAWEGDSLNVEINVVADFSSALASLRLYLPRVGLPDTLVAERPATARKTISMAVPMDLCPGNLGLTGSLMITSEDDPEGEVRGALTLLPTDPVIHMTLGRLRLRYR